MKAHIAIILINNYTSGVVICLCYLICDQVRVQMASDCPCFFCTSTNDRGVNRLLAESAELILVKF